MIPRISYVNYRKLYPHTKAFQHWFCFRRFWSNQLIVIGVRWHFLKLDFRRNWLLDMTDPPNDRGQARREQPKT